MASRRGTQLVDISFILLNTLMMSRSLFALRSPDTSAPLLPTCHDWDVLLRETSWPRAASRMWAEALLSSLLLQVGPRSRQKVFRKNKVLSESESPSASPTVVRCPSPVIKEHLPSALYNTREKGGKRNREMGVESVCPDRPQFSQEESWGLGKLVCSYSAAERVFSWWLCSAGARCEPLQ